jgi:hypothetical protein
MSLRTWAWRHPEWWGLGASAVSWVFLVGIVLEHSGHVAFAAMGMQQHEHGSMPMGADHAERWTLWMFTLMVAAMMIPATIGSIRTTAARSLWRRRQRAVAEFLVAFVGAWIVFGAVVLGVSSLVADAGWLELGGTATAVGFGLAALWQLTPAKRQALNGHHRTRPLAPSGRQADRDCLYFGGGIGRECIVSCGPLMAAMTMGAHSLGTLLVGTAVVWAERYRYRPPRRTSAAALGVTAIILATV